VLLPLLTEHLLLSANRGAHYITDLNMPLFTPAHLGKWERLYRDLLEGETLPMTEEGTWMLADRTGLLAVFDEGETVFIGASDKLGKDLQVAVTGGTESPLRSLVAIVELGAARKNAATRAKSGPLAQRISRKIAKMRYRVVPAPQSQVSALADAFAVVADPRYNGPTGRGNAALDALPK
jgi:hypothetical protein